MLTDDLIISQTKKWILDVVVGCNFCPFAAKEVKRGSVYYEVMHETQIDESLQLFHETLLKLDDDPKIETALLIFPKAFEDFDSYLQLVMEAEDLIAEEGYEGIYQVASFHPEYLFEGADENDPANYTNRSPYPMLHILREESVTRVVDTYHDTESIPEKNIEFARKKGLLFMQVLRQGSLDAN